MEKGTTSGGAACPVCASRDLRRSEVVFRDEERSYRRCPDCGAMILLRACPPSIHYDDDYFSKEYRKQYGRTYLEDMPKLRAFAASRLDIVERLAGGLKGRRVLDIGCAYGAFLLEARERGAEAAGMDPSPEAIERVRSAGMRAERGFFPDTDVDALAEGKPFDVVTMWYVAEHLADLARALASCRAALAPGGLFALSTPNIDGISGKRDLPAFLRASPADHLSVLSPGSARKALKAAGFRVLLTRVTGHHPERFPWPTRKGGAMMCVLGALSRLLRLGDTFEVYARREDGR